MHAAPVSNPWGGLVPPHAFSEPAARTADHEIVVGPGARVLDHRSAFQGGALPPLHTGPRARWMLPFTACEYVNARGDAIVASPNHLLRLPPRARFERRPLDPRGDHHLVLECDAEDADAARWPMPPATFLLAQRLRHAAAAPDRAASLAATLNAALRRLERSPALPCDGGGLVLQQVQCRLEREPMRPQPVATLAAFAGLSPFHLGRRFRQLTGYPLHGYLAQLRLRLALPLLVARSLPITELALALGFAGHSHFSASFRRAFGITPSAWRREASVKAEPGI